jgi:hypothetical protein
MTFRAYITVGQACLYLDEGGLVIVGCEPHLATDPPEWAFRGPHGGVVSTIEPKANDWEEFCREVELFDLFYAPRREPAPFFVPRSPILLTPEVREQLQTKLDRWEQEQPGPWELLEDWHHDVLRWLTWWAEDAAKAGPWPIFLFVLE